MLLGGQTDVQFFTALKMANIRVPVSDLTVCDEYDLPQEKCPNCQSDNIANEDGPNDNILEVTCHDCSFQWSEPSGFQLKIQRVRVDFGNDLFIDQPDAIDTVLLEAKSFELLKKELDRWVETKKGQIVEIEDDLSHVVIDTQDLTIWLKL